MVNTMCCGLSHGIRIVYGGSRNYGSIPVNVSVPTYMGNSNGFYAQPVSYANNPNAISALEFEATRTPTYTRKEKSYDTPKHRWHYEGPPQPVSAQRLYGDGKLYNGSDSSGKQITPLETMAMQQAYREMQDLMDFGDYSRQSHIRLLEQSLEAVKDGDILVLNRQAVYGMLPQNPVYVEPQQKIPDADSRVAAQRMLLEGRIEELRNRIPMAVEDAN